MPNTQEDGDARFQVVVLHRYASATLLFSYLCEDLHGPITLISSVLSPLTPDPSPDIPADP